MKLRLTSRKLKGSINSDARRQEVGKFFTGNNFTAADKEFSENCSRKCARERIHSDFGAR
jgi:hypothetical protein